MCTHTQDYAGFNLALIVKQSSFRQALCQQYATVSLPFLYEAQRCCCSILLSTFLTPFLAPFATCLPAGELLLVLAPDSGWLNVTNRTGASGFVPENYTQPATAEQTAEFKESTGLKPRTAAPHIAASDAQAAQAASAVAATAAVEPDKLPDSDAAIDTPASLSAAAQPWPSTANGKGNAFGHFEEPAAFAPSSDMGGNTVVDKQLPFSGSSSAVHVGGDAAQQPAAAAAVADVDLVAPSDTAVASQAAWATAGAAAAEPNPFEVAPAAEPDPFAPSLGVPGAGFVAPGAPTPDASTDPAGDPLAGDRGAPPAVAEASDSATPPYEKGSSAADASDAINPFAADAPAHAADRQLSQAAAVDAFGANVPLAAADSGAGQADRGGADAFGEPRAENTAVAVPAIASQGLGTQNTHEEPGAGSTQEQPAFGASAPLLEPVAPFTAASEASGSPRLSVDTTAATCPAEPSSSPPVSETSLSSFTTGGETEDGATATAAAASALPSELTAPSLSTSVPAMSVDGESNYAEPSVPASALGSESHYSSAEDQEYSQDGRSASGELQAGSWEGKEQAQAAEAQAPSNEPLLPSSTAPEAVAGAATEDEGPPEAATAQLQGVSVLPPQPAAAANALDQHEQDAAPPQDEPHKSESESAKCVSMAQAVPSISDNDAPPAPAVEATSLLAAANPVDDGSSGPSAQPPFGATAPAAGLSESPGSNMPPLPIAFPAPGAADEGSNLNPFAEDRGTVGAAPSSADHKDAGHIPTWTYTFDQLNGAAASQPHSPKHVEPLSAAGAIAARQQPLQPDSDKSDELDPAAAAAAAAAVAAVEEELAAEEAEAAADRLREGSQATALAPASEPPVDLVADWLAQPVVMTVKLRERVNAEFSGDRLVRFGLQGCLLLGARPLPAHLLHRLLRKRADEADGTDAAAVLQQELADSELAVTVGVPRMGAAFQGVASHVPGVHVGELEEAAANASAELSHRTSAAAAAAAGKGGSCQCMTLRLAAALPELLLLQPPSTSGKRPGLQLGHYYLGPQQMALIRQAPPMRLQVVWRRGNPGESTHLRIMYVLNPSLAAAPRDAVFTVSGLGRLATDSAGKPQVTSTPSAAYDKAAHTFQFRLPELQDSQGCWRVLELEVFESAPTAPAAAGGLDGSADGADRIRVDVSFAMPERTLTSISASAVVAWAGVAAGANSKQDLTVVKECIAGAYSADTNYSNDG